MSYEAHKTAQEITLTEARRTGRTTYFTGVPCIHGHTAHRFVIGHGCQQCNLIAAAKLRRNKPADVAKTQWIQRLKRVYKITTDQHEAMLNTQEHKCAICSCVLNGRGNHSTGAHVDHCHQTGRVRGILCSLCNKGLGCFKDNPEHLTAATKYIQVAQGRK